MVTHRAVLRLVLAMSLVLGSSACTGATRREANEANGANGSNGSTAIGAEKRTKRADEGTKRADKATAAGLREADTEISFCGATWRSSSPVVDCIGRPAVDDLAPLAGFTELRRLRVSLSARAEDIEALAGLSQLRELELDGRRPVSLEPLAGLPLRALDLSFYRGLDLAPVAGLTQLTSLDVGLCVHLHCLVTDGAFEERGGDLDFLDASPPTPERMLAVLAELREVTEAVDDDLDLDPALAACVQGSLGGLRSPPAEPMAPPPMTVSAFGMYLHAATTDPSPAPRGATGRGKLADEAPLIIVGDLLRSPIDDRVHPGRELRTRASRSWTTSDCRNAEAARSSLGTASRFARWIWSAGGRLGPERSEAHPGRARSSSRAQAWPRCERICEPEGRGQAS